MRKLLTLVGANPGVDPRYWFGIAWLAAFLGFVLIIGTVAVAFIVVSNGS